MGNLKNLGHQAGFTLAELMVVVAIAGILAALAGPSFSGLINTTRQNSALTLITGDLNRARGEAIKRNQRVLVCVRDTDAACGNGLDWRNGWLVCYDEDQNGACDATTAANPNPITVRAPINTNLTLVGNAATIRFNPSGTQGAGGAVATLTLGGTWSGATAITANIAATGNITKSP